MMLFNLMKCVRKMGSYIKVALLYRGEGANLYNVVEV